MPEPTTQLKSPDPDAAIRDRILDRARAINVKLLASFKTVADDLELGGHLAALGGLDGIERDIERMRSFLLLLR